jgi:hypothetical protein
MFEAQAANQVAEQEEQTPSLKIDLRTGADNLPDKPRTRDQ